RPTRTPRSATAQLRHRVGRAQRSGQLGSGQPLLGQPLGGDLGGVGLVLGAAPVQFDQVVGRELVDHGGDRASAAASTLSVTTGTTFCGRISDSGSSSTTRSLAAMAGSEV